MSGNVKLTYTDGTAGPGFQIMNIGIGRAFITKKGIAYILMRTNHSAGKWPCLNLRRMVMEDLELTLSVHPVNVKIDITVEAD